MSRKKLSRRQFVAATALSSAALITAPYVRGAYAAGKLSIGFWDHWVPGANKASTDLVNEWAAKEKVEVSIDYIPSQGNKNPADDRRRSVRRSQAMTSSRCRHGGRMRMPNSSSPSTTSWSRSSSRTARSTARCKYLGKAGGKWLGVPACDRQPDQGALLPHRPDEEACRHRRPGDVSGRRPAKGGQLDHGHVPESRGGLPQGRRSLRHRSRRDHRQRRYRRRLLPGVRRRNWSTPRAISSVKTDAVRQALEFYKKLIAFLPPDVGGLGRRLQQQVAGFRQGRDDHESAERLGGRQARRAAGRRTMLDARLPGRTERPVCAVPSLLLEHLEFLQEQGSGQEPAGPPFAAGIRSRRWSRPAAATICRRSRN